MGIIIHKRKRYRDDKISFGEAIRLGIVKDKDEFEKLTGRKVYVRELKKVEKQEEAPKKKENKKEGEGN